MKSLLRFRMGRGDIDTLWDQRSVVEVNCQQLSSYGTQIEWQVLLPSQRF